MEEVFLTKKELAARWKCTTQAIDDRVRDGIIRPVRSLPGVKFRKADVLKLEEDPMDPLSPLERRRLVREIERLNQEVADYRARLMKISVISAEFLAGAAGKAV